MGETLDVYLELSGAKMPEEARTRVGFAEIEEFTSGTHISANKISEDAFD